MNTDYKKLGHLRHSDVMVRREKTGRFSVIDGAHRLAAMSGVMKTVRYAIFKHTLPDDLILAYSTRTLFPFTEAAHLFVLVRCKWLDACRHEVVDYLATTVNLLKLGHSEDQITNEVLFRIRSTAQKTVRLAKRLREKEHTSL